MIVVSKFSLVIIVSKFISFIIIIFVTTIIVFTITLVTIPIIIMLIIIITVITLIINIIKVYYCRECYLSDCCHFSRNYNVITYMNMQMNISAGFVVHYIFMKPLFLWSYLFYHM